MGLQSINPMTSEGICSYQEMSRQDVDQILEKTQEAFSGWRKTSFAERAAKIRKAAEILKSKRVEYARLMAEEMGKPLKQGASEAEKCAWVCEYYADNAEKFLREETIETDAAKSFVTFQPLGIVLAVMPWNFPFWQVFRFAAPGLMAGNAAVLKHASNVTGCALAIENIFEEAGFPENLFRTLVLSSRNVESVIEHPLTRAVTLTGSTPAGKAVAAKAGSVLKKAVLELGGTDPYLILEDADLEDAVTACVTSRLINGGQSCIAAKRFIVVGALKEEFERLFVEQMSQKTMGDPLREEVDLGPMARHDLRDQLHDQVKRSIRAGAKLLLGGEIPKDKGAFYPPTVLTDVRKGMPAFEEEMFGPAAAIIPVSDEKDAVEVANDSVFGLGAAVFSRDKARAERLAAKELEAGCCFVNSFVKSDPRLPFGGVKESGFGRELSHYGIKEFVNIKTVYVK